jgi:hypothetical protein
VDEYSNTKIVISTRNCEIVEYRASKSKVLACGHYGSKCTGVTVEHLKKRMFTIGEEGLVTCWSLEKNMYVKRNVLDYNLQCCAISNNGLYLAIGCKDGHILVLNPENLEI